jgi:elongation factor 1 alpha-like protein
MLLSELCTALRKPICSVASIPGDFWKDMRWLQTSSERQSLFIPPFQPRGGLLGGAPEVPAKMSKLQALAVARKKKAQEQKIAAGNSVENPMASLSIGEKSAPSASPAASDSSKSTQNTVGSQGISRDTQRTYPPRKRKNSSPHRKSSQHAESPEPEVVPLAITRPPSPAIETAQPSAFANTMFSVSSTARRRKPSNPVFTLPYSLQNTSTSANTTDAFTGPSPDDIVIAAQSKGLSKPQSATSSKR